MWSLVIPVKRLSAAKTRLAPLPTGRRADLALAFVHDCVAAALAAPQVGQVLVVTADDAAARGLAGLGARIAAEPEAADGADRLNAAIVFGAGRSRSERPDLRVGALTGDLPSLRTEELGAVLQLAAAIEGRSFVPDAAGSGTTLLLGAADGTLDPRFGPESRARHAHSGAAELFGVGRSVRQDVDTLADLETALGLGVGVHTAHEIGLGLMQGTVRSFDPATRGGTVLLDDGTELPYDAAAFDAGGLRLARIGQRVALRADTAGRITALTLATLPLPD
ncbi:MAG TPA: 2-phospho-L-lactate guanylyltransferase [Actinospica sp.]|nr:2-phospho-L-lactate guanylyltransferase [Actinospica sp.]